MAPIVITWSDVGTRNLRAILNLEALKVYGPETLERLGAPVRLVRPQVMTWIVTTPEGLAKAVGILPAQVWERMAGDFGLPVPVPSPDPAVRAGIYHRNLIGILDELDRVQTQVGMTDENEA